MIINSVLPSVGKVITKVRIKPFARALLDGTTSAWISNDPNEITSHGSISISPSSTQIIQIVSPGYQIVSYYEMVAVYSDGSEVDLRYLANAGRDIKATLSVALPVSPAVGDALIFNGQQVSGGEGTSTLTCPTDISTYNIIGYDNGTTVAVAGCFMYVSTKANASTGNRQTTANFSTDKYITIEGAKYPIELSTDWGDR